MSAPTSTQDDNTSTQSDSQLPSNSQPQVPPSQQTTESATSTIADNKDSQTETQADTTTTEEVTQPKTEDPEATQDPDEMDVDRKPITNGNTTAAEEEAPPPLVESRIPAKKDETLREFLNKMDDYAPIIPDAVTNYYLTLAGLPPPPQTSPHLARLIALAAQKFVSDIAADAYQYARIRASNTSSSNNPLSGLGAAGGAPGAAAAPGAGAPGATTGPAGGKAAEKSANLGAPRAGFGGGGQGGGQGRTVLTMEDLGMAVGEYGINVKRGEFYR